VSPEASYNNNKKKEFRSVLDFTPIFPEKIKTYSGGEVPKWLPTPLKSEKKIYCIILHHYQ